MGGKRCSHRFTECAWYVGPLCSQHWSTSLSGCSLQHDPSSNKPVIDPVVLLWIPMARWLNMCSMCELVFYIYWFVEPHLANLYTGLWVYPKAIVIDIELS